MWLDRSRQRIKILRQDQVRSIRWGLELTSQYKSDEQEHSYFHCNDVQDEVTEVVGSHAIVNPRTMAWTVSVEPQS